MRPIKDRKAFFETLEESLQGYFDQYDKNWGGILHLTIGVRSGEVGGIIKSESTLRYEGYSRQRIETILHYVLPRYVKRTELPYAVDDVINELLGIASPAIEVATETTEVEVQVAVVEPTKKRENTKRRKNNENISETISSDMD